MTDNQEKQERMEEDSIGDGRNRRGLPELNEVALAGRLTAAPSLDNFGEDKTRARFSLAVPRPRFGRNNPGEESARTADFIDVTAWRLMAQECAKLNKGDAVQIQGRLRTWTDKTGRARWNVEADMLQILDRKAGSFPPNAHGGGAQPLGGMEKREEEAA